MCCLSLSELSDETRNEWGLPTADETDPVLMGANDMSEARRERRRICDEPEAGRMAGDVPKWVHQTSKANDDKRLFMRAIWWATATGFFFGALIASAAVMWWLT